MTSAIAGRQLAEEERTRALFQCVRCGVGLSGAGTSSKLLPCLHPVCYPCLQFIYSQGKNKCGCPRCDYPFEGHQTVPHILPGLNNVLRCSGCVNNAVAWCTNCEEVLCEECTQAHRRVTATRHHQINPVNPRIARPEMYCRTHPTEELQYFCNNCKAVTCSYCQEQHKNLGHTHSTAMEAANVLRESFPKLIENNNNRLMNLRNSQNVVQKRMAEIDVLVMNRKQELGKILKNLVETFQSVVARRGKQILYDLESAAQHKKDDYIRKQKDIQVITSMLQQAQHVAEQTQKTRNPVAMLEMRRVLVNHMNQVKVLNVDLNTLQNPVFIQIQASPIAPDIFQKVSTFGQVLVDRKPFVAPAPRSESQPRPPQQPQMSRPQSQQRPTGHPPTSPTFPGGQSRGPGGNGPVGHPIRPPIPSPHSLQGSSPGHQQAHYGQHGVPGNSQISQMHPGQAGPHRGGQQMGMPAQRPPMNGGPQQFRSPPSQQSSSVYPGAPDGRGPPNQTISPISPQFPPTAPPPLRHAPPPSRVLGTPPTHGIDGTISNSMERNPHLAGALIGAREPQQQQQQQYQHPPAYQNSNVSRLPPQLQQHSMRAGASPHRNSPQLPNLTRMPYPSAPSTEGSSFTSAPSAPSNYSMQSSTIEPMGITENERAITSSSYSLLNDLLVTDMSKSVGTASTTIASGISNGNGCDSPSHTSTARKTLPRNVGRSLEDVVRGLQSSSSDSPSTTPIPTIPAPTSASSASETSPSVSHDVGYDVKTEIPESSGENVRSLIDERVKLKGDDSFDHPITPTSTTTSVTNQELDSLETRIPDSASTSAAYENPKVIRETCLPINDIDMNKDTDKPDDVPNFPSTSSTAVDRRPVSSSPDTALRVVLSRRIDGTYDRRPTGNATSPQITETASSETPEYSASTSVSHLGPSTSTSTLLFSQRSDSQWDDWCFVCRDGCTENDERMKELLCCDACPRVYHLDCHIPAVPTFPLENESWLCSLCQNPEPLRAGKKRHHSGQLNPYEHKLCEKLLLGVSSGEDAAPFRHEVNGNTEVGRVYYKVIKKPMDMGMIRLRLSQDHYSSVPPILDDLNRVFKNCSRFNKPGSVMAGCGRKVYSEYTRLVSELFPQYTDLIWQWASRYKPVVASDLGSSFNGETTEVIEKEEVLGPSDPKVPKTTENNTRSPLTDVFGSHE